MPTVPLNGNGGLFQKLGALASALAKTNVYRGTTLPGFAPSITAAYGGTDANLLSALSANISGTQNANSPLAFYFASTASATLVQDIASMAAVSDSTIPTALKQLVALMQAQGQTVAANTVATAIVPNAQNVGTGVLVASTKLPNGLTAENAFPETLAATITADGRTNGGARAGQEVLTIVGQQAVSDPLNWAYPGGSGATVAIRAVNASLNNQGRTQNWLANGDFESWASGLPVSWHVTAGANRIVQGQPDFTGGFGALQFTGDSATLTGLYQEIGSDTTTVPIPLDQWAVNLWARLDVIPSSGALEIALVDGNGTIINDAAGTPNVVTRSLASGLGAWGYGTWGSGTWGQFSGNGSWGNFLWGQNLWGEDIGAPYVPISAVFRTPANLPANVRLRIRLSTPLSSGTNLWIDRVGLAEMTSLYTQGPSVALFGGSENFLNGDSFSLQVMNNRASVFQNFFDSVFGMRSLNLLLPSSSNPSVPNSLAA